MPRKKRASRDLEKAEIRAAGLRAIDPQLDFGGDCSLGKLTFHIEQLRAKIEDYNTALSVIDSSRNEIQAVEQTLRDLSERLLIGVAFRYGKDSSEYEMAGGVRKSERLRRSRSSRVKAPDTPAATSQSA